MKEVLPLIRKEEEEEEFEFPSLSPSFPKVAVQTISNGEGGEGRKGNPNSLCVRLTDRLTGQPVRISEQCQIGFHQMAPLGNQKCRYQASSV